MPLSMFFKKGVLKNFAKFDGKHCGGDSFLIKLQAEGLQLYFKIETPTQVLSCEFSEISKKHPKEHL